ncbi:hypothetical protein [Cellulomonas sp. S1-8]|uniref:hypothetical protein n=1 Tax=Cellulomonas sp. S1-8 TaxID=2904790 RepID=UPI002244387D|nr:hypothetical protein [Cellulomonas sp. S1-8]UZN03806.1 hypothetical protein OKX07_02360 [Cellulomonas sp. S1-8]
MRYRMLTRLALGLSLTVALTGTGAAAASAGPDSSRGALDPSSSWDAAAAAPHASADAPRAAATSATADRTVKGLDWPAFRSVNLARLSGGSEPVSRRAELDSIAGDWASRQVELGWTQNAEGSPQDDPDLEWKVPAGSLNGTQGLIYSWGTWEDGSPVTESDFLGLVDYWLHEWERESHWASTMTDAGVAIAHSDYGWVAYIILVQYPHSTAAADEMPLYRFYVPSTGTHFYSTSDGERNTVISYPEYLYEGRVAYIKAPRATSLTTPLADLNRFQLKGTASHFYTANTLEYAQVVKFPQYQLDGIAGRVFSASGPGLTAMHRFFRPASGTHFYSANPDEIALVKAMPEYAYEGPAFYLRIAS